MPVPAHLPQSTRPDGPAPAGATPEELVVLLDGEGRAIGTAPKASVHTSDTPLHLAFSCYVLRGDRMLITQRAQAKPTWPGVWTNACCGHPAPGEAPEAAVRRRLDQELGLQDVTDLELVHPDFRYRAVMDNGLVEHELCPVYLARVPDGADPRPDPREVADHRWLTVAEFRTELLRDPQDHSPWALEQLEALRDHDVLGAQAPGGAA